MKMLTHRERWACSSKYRFWSSYWPRATQQPINGRKIRSSTVLVWRNVTSRAHWIDTWSWIRFNGFFVLSIWLTSEGSRVHCYSALPIVPADCWKTEQQRNAIAVECWRLWWSGSECWPVDLWCGVGSSDAGADRQAWHRGLRHRRRRVDDGGPLDLPGARHRLGVRLSLPAHRRGGRRLPRPVLPTAALALSRRARRPRRVPARLVARAAPRRRHRHRQAARAHHLTVHPQTAPLRQRHHPRRPLLHLARLLRGALAVFHSFSNVLPGLI